jgi:hypothetical protein
MKNIICAIAAVLLVTSCNKKVEVKQEEKVGAYAKFGDSISPDGAISKEDLLAKYTSLKPTDTLEIKVASKIVDVCQKKGCWMNIDLGSSKTALVRFKDYGFFVPKNASESDVILHGKAFVEVTPISDLKEYAKDAGKSQAAIDSIVAPETNYSFMADGVLIKK